jgi:phenylacetate-CoA ligase
VRDAGHEMLSRRLLLPLMRWQGMVRRSRRPAMLAYREGMRFRWRSDGWTDDERLAWVLARLRHVVRLAARDTAYYGELFERVKFDPERDFSFEEFATLPVLERDDVRHGGSTLVSRVIAPDQLLKDATGGSTGAPTEVWLGPEERGWRESGIDFCLARAGAPPGSAIAYLWGHHLDPVQRQTLRERFHDVVANSRWFDCFRLSPDILEAYHVRLERWRPTAVIAYASALAALADHVVERGHRPTYPRRCFVTGAEKLLQSQRDQIERAFGKPIYERYGSRDVGPIGFQRDPENTLGYTIDWGNVLVEPERDGAESILVTKLHADGMPMIRYRVGDLGRFPLGSAPGHPVFFLREIVGRNVDFIWHPDGRCVHPIEFPHLMKDFPVREFSVLQRPDYSVQIQVVPREGFGDESRDRILKTVRDNLPGLPVELLLVDEIPRTAAGKLRPVVSEVGRLGRGEGRTAIPS